MTSRARLLATHVPRGARDRIEGAVLVLHGGASRQQDMRVSPTQLSVLRMVPIAHRMARAGRGRLAVFRLLNSVRGWDTDHTPVDDVAWAIGQLRARFDRDLPLALVGHSLGGRAALLAGRQPSVRAVAALNPWLYPEDGAVDLAGRRVLVVHGTDDRVARPERAEAAATRLARSAELGFVHVVGGKHAMLRRGGVFERLAADFATGTLLGREPSGLLADAFAGRGAVTV